MSFCTIVIVHFTIATIMSILAMVTAIVNYGCHAGAAAQYLNAMCVLVSLYAFFAGLSVLLAVFSRSSLQAAVMTFLSYFGGFLFLVLCASLAFLFPPEAVPCAPGSPWIRVPAALLLLCFQASFFCSQAVYFFWALHISPYRDLEMSLPFHE